MKSINPTKMFMAHNMMLSEIGVYTLRVEKIIII